MNLKEQILAKAMMLFMHEGYEKTTMRRIASELGLAVGNVNYYYPKKEDIIKDYHNNVMETFVSRINLYITNESDWVTYFMSEYSFISYVAHNKYIREVYKSVINVENLRAFYIDKHQELFLSIFKDHSFKNEDLYISCAAMCAVEFELISRFNEEWDFDDLMRHVFETRLAFLHLDLEEYLPVIQEGIEKGKEFNQVSLII